MFGGPKVLVLNQPSRTEYVTRDVHEHRAPTDESVKLLREMEGKAKEQIIKAVHVGDTTFECVVHQMRHAEDQSQSLRAVFSMNGKKMTVTVRDHGWEANDEKKLAMKLRDEMASEIATTILLPALIRYVR